MSTFDWKLKQNKERISKLRVSFSLSARRVLSARHLSVRVCVRVRMRISNVVLRRCSRCLLRTAQ